VKHGLVKQVRDYRWSSFRRFVKLGEYPLEWGNDEDIALIRNLDWE
jgi:putative transposase